jgi:heme/copper-type cytochrome/quinol oxidase subunit 2
MNDYSFRWVLMLACLLIFAVSFVVLLWAAWRHHRSGTSERGNFHSSLAVEIAWTFAPCVIVVWLVWPTARIFWTT